MSDSILPTRDELKEQGLTVADAVARQYPVIVIDYAMPQDIVNAMRNVPGFRFAGSDWVVERT